MTLLRCRHVLVLGTFCLTVLPSIIWFSLAVCGADMTLAPCWSFCIDIGKQQSGVPGQTRQRLSGLPADGRNGRNRPERRVGDVHRAVVRSAERRTAATGLGDAGFRRRQSPSAPRQRTQPTTG